MSIFSGVGKVLKGAVKTFAGAGLSAIGTSVGGPIGGGIANVVAGNIMGTSSRRVTLPTGFAASAAQFSPPALTSRVPMGFTDLLPDIGVPGPGIFSPTQPPKGYHLSKKRKGVPQHFVKNRRMNPTNHRAAMRAARRLIAFRKAVMRTEKALRKAVPPSHRRARLLPRGHHARIAHD